ncbi:MAG: DUF2357 domain-containing protein, partial [Rummeliibacillus sp.]
MKLCIIKPDGSSAETILGDNQPSLENINNDILLFENYLYKLIIRSEESFDSIELFVGDYSIPLIFNESTGCYETEKDTVFGGCFDLVCVSVNIDNAYREEGAYYSEYLRIATTKQTARQVEQMLGEIENSLPNFLEVCFSRSRKKAGLIKNDIRSIWNTLRIIDEIISVYEENYGYFSNHKKSTVDQDTEIVDVKSMRKIDQESLIWITSNPDNLVVTEKESVIKYKEKYYTPTKVKTYISRYSYDIYENRMILGFLRSVIEYINKQITGFEREILELENIPNSIIVQLPNTHELTGRCIYVYYKGVMERFEKKRDVLQELYYRYVRILECVAEGVFSLPKLTNTFKQVYHYRICYECMVKWFEAGDYSFDYLNYLFKLKTLSRIFEYFCLIKLQTAIVQNGYVLTDASRVVYDIEDDLEDINNKYVFSGHGYELTLLYEPTIWVNRLNDGINLYSTGYNFTKRKWNDRWTPDFVMKITTFGNEYYYILDSKYSNFQNVKKRYIPELVLKYSSQIASKDKFFSDVIGVGAIYPSDSDKMCYFKKNMVNSNRQSLPKYFSLAIIGEEEGNNALRARILSLLDVVDALEAEVIPQVSEHREEEMNGRGSDDNHNISSETNVEKNILEDNDFSHSEKIEENGVYGKRCFYYSKGMCLRQKIRCTIEGNLCELYEHKNSKELLREEDSCRNFIQYIRKGKVRRVECSVSGLPGCVGSDKC